MELSYCRHRFPPVVIQHAVWVYLRFTLSYRDVEDLLVERGLDISYETVRSWVLKFGPVIARRLRGRCPRPSGPLAPRPDGCSVCRQADLLLACGGPRRRGPRHLVQSHRDSRAALLMRKLLRKQGFVPKLPITDKLRSCGSAFRQSKGTPGE
jgi:putative transposase